MSVLVESGHSATRLASALRHWCSDHRHSARRSARPSVESAFAVIGHAKRAIWIERQQADGPCGTLRWSHQPRWIGWI